MNKSCSFDQLKQKEDLSHPLWPTYYVCLSGNWYSCDNFKLSVCSPKEPQGVAILPSATGKTCIGVYSDGEALVFEMEDSSAVVIDISPNPPSGPSQLTARFSSTSDFLGWKDEIDQMEKLL